MADVAVDAISLVVALGAACTVLRVLSYSAKCATRIAWVSEYGGGWGQAKNDAFFTLYTRQEPDRWGFFPKRNAKQQKAAGRIAATIHRQALATAK